MGLISTKLNSDGLTVSFGCLFIFLTHILKIFLDIFIALYLIIKNILFVFLLHGRYIKI